MSFETESRYYAHTLPGEPPEHWQPLEEHLRSVAEQAAAFASRFGARDWGYTAGLWHDLGKFSERFQQYLSRHCDYHLEEQQLEEQQAKTDHTSAGAQHAVKTLNILSHLLSYPIAGHHAGLHDAISNGACLDKRLKKSVDPWRHGLELLPKPPELQLPPFIREALSRRDALAMALFVRMLFSCLVDADYLDTEHFMDPMRAHQRPKWEPDILERMEAVLDEHVAALRTDASCEVDTRRRDIREACLTAADKAPGLFSLTVPTGGGKTLSSLAFALRHARIYGLERVIYVIPFTSIIEQNAEVFRKVFRPLVETGVPNPVLEHHSALEYGPETLANRPAAENWDAPLVVTTSVQFYESLFSNRSSRCRRLHNIARAVVILDEAQKIPVDYLHPCLHVLRELAVDYGSSLVLCTATQPAVHQRSEFPIGFQGVREITPDPAGLYLALKRVQVKDLGSIDDEALADRLRSHERVLCIVNTRRHARELFHLLSDLKDAVHLSAAMCPAHRMKVIDELKMGQPCHAISTQLVEAGVDVDFPVVYRSLAGLDSIAQAAGRCNRNGSRKVGITWLFRPKDSARQKSETFLRDTTNAASQILGTGDSPPLYDDPLALEAIEHYFRLYYWSQQQRWDYHHIFDQFQLVNNPELPFQFNFHKASSAFRLIQDTGKSVIVPWSEEGRALTETLRQSFSGAPDINLLRRLQRYTVRIPARILEQQLGRAIELVHDRYPLLTSADLYYDERLGLVLDRDDFDSESFIT